MLNSYDIIILTLIIIIIGIIIVINVKKSLNNKLSNVEIKIPEIQIPQQDIIVKVQKECSSDKFDVFVHSEDKINFKSQNIKLTPISINPEKKIEKFSTTSKSPSQDQPITQTKTSGEEDIGEEDSGEEDSGEEDSGEEDSGEEDSKDNKKNSFQKEIDSSKQKSESETEIKKQTKKSKKKKRDIEGEEVNVKSLQHMNLYKDAYPSTFKFIKFPDNEKMLDYDNYDCQKKREIRNEANKKITSPFPAYSCADPKAIKAYNFKQVKDILKNEPYDDDEEYDSLAYFLKNRQFIPAAFSDGVTVGSNVDAYGSYGGLDDIGKIALGKSSFNYTKPKNYMFMGIELKNQN